MYGALQLRVAHLGDAMTDQNAERLIVMLARIAAALETIAAEILGVTQEEGTR